jgi:hypothetical protein
MICYNDDVPLHMLPWKFNTWVDLSLRTDIHVLHYSVGPSFLGGDVIPVTSKLYEMHDGFKYYRKLSLGVDGCSQHQLETECLSSDLQESVQNAMGSKLSLYDNYDPDLRFNRCTWIADRCISRNLSTLQLGGINEEMKQMASANRALQCAFNDNPAAALALVYNCGTFCMKALLWEEYCEKNFSLFHCTGLVFRHSIDYRSYNLIPIGIASLSCLPGAYRWCIVGGTMFVIVLVCFLFWLFLTTLRIVVCSCSGSCMCPEWFDEKDKLLANPSLIYRQFVHDNQDNLELSTFTKIRDTIISINLTHTNDKTK